MATKKGLQAPDTAIEPVKAKPKRGPNKTKVLTVDQAKLTIIDADDIESSNPKINSLHTISSLHTDEQYATGFKSVVNKLSNEELIKNLKLRHNNQNDVLIDSLESIYFGVAAISTLFLLGITVAQYVIRKNKFKDV